MTLGRGVHNSFLDDDIDELLLCPIRFLRKYLSWTEQYHPGKKQVSGNTISSWIRSVFSHTHEFFDEDCRSVGVKAHKVRKIATSLLFRRDCAVQQIFQVSKHLLSLLPSRCCPQAYGHLFHQLCGSLRRSYSSLALSVFQCSNSRSSLSWQSVMYNPMETHTHPPPPMSST